MSPPDLMGGHGPARAVGVDIGGTEIAAGLVTHDGTVLRSVYADTPPRSAVPSVVENVVVQALAELGADPDLPVGVGAAGFVDPDRGVVQFAPHLSWRNEPLAQRLAERLGRTVCVENDANAAAWAEYRFGAAREERRLVLITLGTGIGGAMVFDGALERGRYGMAGEFGHMCVVPDGRLCPCGQRGCWEQYASGPALRWVAVERMSVQGSARPGWVSNIPAVTGRMVTDRALAGDCFAQECVREVGTWLGRGLANVCAALDPGLIIVGGGVAQAGELLLAPARAAFGHHLSGADYRQVPRLIGARLGPAAGVIGAADLAARAEGAELDARRRSAEPSA